VLADLAAIKAGHGWWHQLPKELPNKMEERRQCLSDSDVWAKNEAAFGLAEIRDPAGIIYRIFRAEEVLSHVAKKIRSGYVQPRLPGVSKTKKKTSAAPPGNKRLAGFAGWYYNPWRARIQSAFPTNLHHGNPSWESVGANGAGWFTDGVVIIRLPERPAFSAWRDMGKTTLSDYMTDLAKGPFIAAEILAEAYQGPDKFRNDVEDSPVHGPRSVCAHVLDAEGGHWLYNAEKLDFVLTQYPGVEIRMNTALKSLLTFFHGGVVVAGQSCLLLDHSSDAGTFSSLPENWRVRYQQLFGERGKEK
jgi:hypothetical protein